MPDVNTLMKSSYINTKGVTHPSFKIGKDGVKLSSKAAADESSKIILNQFKRLCVSEAGEEDGQELNVLYDVDIPLTSVKNVSEPAGTNNVILSLFSGSIITITRDVDALSVEGETAEGEIVVFVDATGKKAKSSGATIFTSDQLPEALSDYTDSTKWNPTDKQVPTMKTMSDFVGDLSTPLANRLNGILDLRGGD